MNTQPKHVFLQNTKLIALLDRITQQREIYIKSYLVVTSCNKDIIWNKIA